MNPKTRVLFLIPSLVAAGAERQLCELVRNMNAGQFDIHVVLFYDPASFDGVELSSNIQGLPNVTLHCLHKRRGVGGYPGALIRLVRLTKRVKPDVLHGYLDGNLPALVVGKLLGKPSVWGIRAATRDRSLQSRQSNLLSDLMVTCSRFASLLIFNSKAGLKAYEDAGMRTSKVRVIPNGFDTSRFKPDAGAGARQRELWGVDALAPLVGIVGRLDPIKDHPTFLRAAATVSRSLPSARFVCVGMGPQDYLESLQGTAESLGIGDRVLWPGVSGQMTGVYNALSLLVLSSFEEGFPNVIGEAMACGIPCVSTRAGDAAELIGDTGLTVEVGDSEALAQGVIRLLSESPEDRAVRSRNAEARITTVFSTQALARTTEGALLGLLRTAPANVLVEQ